MRKCFLCAQPAESKFGYEICSACLQGLALHSDATILKNKQNFEVENKPLTYLQEVEGRLKQMEEDYHKKRIKLLHIKDRLINIIR